MREFLIGGLAVAGGLYLSKVTACYVLKKYKKEIKKFVIEKVVTYFLTDEEGEDVDSNEVLMMAINAYLKQKGASK